MKNQIRARKSLRTPWGLRKTILFMEAWYILNAITFPCLSFYIGVWGRPWRVLSNSSGLLCKQEFLIFRSTSQSSERRNSRWIRCISSYRAIEGLLVWGLYMSKRLTLSEMIVFCLQDSTGWWIQRQGLLARITPKAHISLRLITRNINSDYIFDFQI